MYACGALISFLMFNLFQLAELFLEDAAAEEGVEEMVGVDVHAETLVPTEVEELLGLEHGFLAVGAGEGGYVELEDDAELVEMAVVLHVHVLVALGVGEDGGVAALTDALEQLLHLVGGIEIAGLYEDEAVVEGEEVVGLEALLEEVVHHVLGGEAELDSSFVLGEEGVEALAEVGGGIGHVFHDVWGEHDALHAFLLEPVEDLEGALEVLDAVVDAGEYVAVPVGEPGEEAAA